MTTAAEHGRQEAERFLTEGTLDAIAEVRRCVLAGIGARFVGAPPYSEYGRGFLTGLLGEDEGHALAEQHWQTLRRNARNLLVTHHDGDLPSVHNMIGSHRNHAGLLLALSELTASAADAPSWDASVESTTQ